MEESIATLLESYGFELTPGETPNATATRWLAAAEADWVRLAVLEALHQGRYKAISVEQILRTWQRRGEPIYHFTPEFERFICQKLPQRHLPVVPPPPPSLLFPLERPPLGPSGEIASFSPLPDGSELFAKLQEAARQEAANLPGSEGANDAQERPIGEVVADESDDAGPAAID